MLRARNSYWPIIKRSWREALLLALAALILISLTGFSFWLADRAERDRRSAMNLAQYNARLSEFVLLMRGMESSHRGYLLTSNPEFLEPYTRMQGQVGALFTELREEVPKESEAGSVLGLLRPVVEERLSQMSATIALLKEGQRDIAIRRVEEGYGRRLMEQIEQGIDSIQRKGRESQWQNEAETAHFERLKLRTDIVGGVLIVSLSMISLFLFLRSSAALQQAQAALELANDELEETVQERTAALKRANEEIQRFAYIVSHDLRSPLVNIMGFTSELETLRKDLFEKLEAANALKDAEHLGQEFDEAFGFIKSAIGRMDRLIGAILKISREGSRALSPEPLDMKATVETIVSGIAHQIRERDVEVSIGELPSIVSDRLAVEQIFANLIDNAIKFLKPDEPGKVVVSGQDRGLQVRFTIEDNGRGVDPKDHQRIFELFRRAGPQTVPGEGMGLAYVVALLRRLGGTIDIESTLGEGCKFIITMPKFLAQPKRKAA